MDSAKGRTSNKAGVERKIQNGKPNPKYVIKMNSPDNKI